MARYSERHSQAGKKSDPVNAAVLAGILRTDRHLDRSLPQITDDALGGKAAARQHQEAIWALHKTISRRRAVLLEFCPQAVIAFPKLNHPPRSRSWRRRRDLTTLEASACTET